MLFISFVTKLRLRAHRAPPTPDEVRAELASLLASPRFRRAGLNGAFLRHVVERALEGGFEALEESAIAREVFGRDDTFDPATDCVVRLVARRVRRNLRVYYARRRDHAVVIALPRNSYSPVFTTRRPRTAPRRAFLKTAAVIAGAALSAGAVYLAGQSAWRFWTFRHGPWHTYRSVSVAPFRNQTGVRRFDPFLAVLGNELAARLAAYPGLSVRSTAAETQLRGSADVVNQRLRFTLELVDSSGARLWGQSYDAPEPQLIAMTGDIAYSVATAMGATGR